MKPFPTVKKIHELLDQIFPEGIENRNYLIRELSAKTIFVMLYCDAIEGRDIWIRPNQITKMTDTQAKIISPKSRQAWCTESLRPGSFKDISNRWYAVDTREPIRDETIRYGLITVNAVFERKNIPTTSSKPRYALRKEFSDLFFSSNPKMDILHWQKKNLTPESLARIKLLKKTSKSSKGKNSIFIKLPDGQTRKMSPGPSSVLTKSAIENFCITFLHNPAIIFISESGNKIIHEDDQTAKSIGINLNVKKNLPDIIVADITDDQKVIIYFIEIVYTDGPINTKRRDDLIEIVNETNFKLENVKFLSVFKDRNAQPFKRLISSIAKNTLIWFTSEPEYIMIWNNLKDYKISDLQEYLEN